MIPVGKPGEKPRHRASLVNNEETHREQNRRKHWNISAKQQTWERSKDLRKVGCGKRLGTELVKPRKNLWQVLENGGVCGSI